MPLVDRQGDTRSDRAIITPAPHRTLILVKVPCSIAQFAGAAVPTSRGQAHAHLGPELAGGSKILAEKLLTALMRADAPRQVGLLRLAR